jgi:GT2 family glycosyltransferase
VPSLTAIVPATDAPPSLSRCLAAIEAAADPPEQILVIESPPGAGPAEARNRGAAEAGGEVLVFVDSDVLVHADAFRRIRAGFDADAGLSAIFGSYDLDSGAGGAVSAFRNLLHHHVHQQSAGPATSFWAGLGAVRRSALFEAGGFDADRYPRPAIEDIELGARLLASGRRIELDPDLLGTHLKRWSLASMVRTDLLARGLPWARLLLERRTVPAAMNLGWRHRLSALASAIAAGALLRRRPVAAASGLGVLIALNHRFYALLRERHGWPTAAAGVGLHLVHHLTSVAAAALALLSATIARSTR